MSKIGENVAKFVVCCSRDWRFKGYLTVIISGDFGLSPDEHDDDEFGDGYDCGDDEYPEVSDWLSWRCIWVRRSMDKLMRSSGTVVMPDSLL